MDLRQLQYLVSLSRTLNFSRAAEEMFISQPTLSQQIKKLEEELGVKLLERSTHGVIMTPVGIQCVEQALRAVAAADELKEIAQKARRQFSNKLYIGVLSVYPQLDISRLITEFQASNLDITVNMRFGWSKDLLGRLRQDKVDIIITNLDEDMISRAEKETYDIQVFLVDKLYLIIGDRNSASQQTSASLEDVLGQDLFLPGSNSSINTFLVKAIHGIGRELPDFVECPSITSAINFLENGRGASVLSGHVSASYVREGIRRIPIEPPIWTYTAIVTKKETLRRPAVKSFQQYFLSHARG